MILGRWLLVGLVALGGSGCAGYKLGPVNGQAAGAKSVQINPFTNKTLEPRLGDELTAQLRKQLQRDGTFALASHNDGDIVVSGSVIRYQRQVVSLSPSDTLTVRDYRLEMLAQVTATDRRSGKLILNQPVTGYTLIRVTTDLTSTERQAVPLLAADLAKNVTALLAEGGW
jgi:Lipopolysaccharide-assembly